MQKIEWLLKYFQSIIYGLNFYVLNPLKLIILNVKYWPLQITGLSFINNMSVLSILECRPKKRYCVLFRGFFVCFLVFGFFFGPLERNFHGQNSHELGTRKYWGKPG